MHQVLHMKIGSRDVQTAGNALQIPKLIRSPLNGPTNCKDLFPDNTAMLSSRADEVDPTKFVDTSSRVIESTSSRLFESNMVKKIVG